jgi:hypothetical protein
MLEGLVKEKGTARAVGQIIGREEGVISRWRRYAQSYPDIEEVLALAPFLQRPVEEIARAIAACRAEWVKSRRAYRQAIGGTQMTPSIPRKGGAKVETRPRQLVRDYALA